MVALIACRMGSSRLPGKSLLPLLGQPMDLIWGQPVASTDAWAGTVAGAVVEVDGRVVTHVVVKRGLLLPRRHVVPFAHMWRSDAEGHYLDVSTTELFEFPNSGSPDDETPSAHLTSRTRATTSDGAAHNSRGLRYSEELRVTHLVVSRSRWTGRRLLVPEGLVDDLTSAGVQLRAEAKELDGLPTYRADAEIENELWEALHADESIPPVDLSGMRLEVSEGVVRLEGNSRSSTAISDAERTVRSVGGVAGLDNRLVSDWDIDLAVASYVVGVSPELSGSVSAHTQLGTVQMEGWVPSADTRQTIIQAVGSIDGVLGVEDGMEVRALAPESPEDSAVAAEGEVEGGALSERSAESTS